MGRFLAVCAGVNAACFVSDAVAAVVHPGHWPYLVAGGALLGTTVAIGGMRRQAGAPVSESRTPVLSLADCPEGACPVCGMHDPARLDGGVHLACVEWLGWNLRSSLTDQFTDAALVSGVRGGIPMCIDPELITYMGSGRSERKRRSAIGGHRSADVTINDLPPPPSAMMQPCAHEHAEETCNLVIGVQRFCRTCGATIERAASRPGRHEVEQEELPEM